MKLAFLSLMQGGRWGGSEGLWTLAATRAAEAGHEVLAMIPAYGPPRSELDPLRAAGAQVIEYPPVRFDRAGERRRRLLIRHPALAQRLLPVFKPQRELTTFHPDALLISQGGTFCLSSHPDYEVFQRYVADNSIPFAMVCHTVEEDIIRSESAIELMRETFGQAAWVGFVSERQLSRTRRQLTSEIDNAVVVRNAVAMSDTSPIPWPLAPVPQLAMISRIDVSTKAHDTLLEVLADRAWSDRDWKLGIYGTGPHEPYVRRLIDFYGLSSRVEMRGFTADVRSVWNDHHLMLQPSRLESAPLSMVEAMLCGRVCVATDVGGVTEWIEEPHHGYIAEATTPSSFHKALDRAWNDQPRWCDIGLAAHDRAKNLVGDDPVQALLDKLVGSSTLSQTG